MLKSAVWFVTMACNFKCDYCWEVQAQERGDFKPEPFKPANDWIQAWNRLAPEILDITGGEPFLQPDLPRIIKEITANGRTRMAMTTNLSHSILDFVLQVSPDKLFSITASYHPTQHGVDRKHPMNEEIFLGRLLLLREFGFSVTINIVAYPEQIWLIPRWLHLFRDVHKFRVHIDPYAPIAYFPWKLTDKERAALDQWVTEDRPIEQPQGVSVRCSGGIDHLSVQPDGSAWRCILERQQRLNPVGNIFDPEFRLFSAPLRCDQQHNCPGCDRDKVSVEPIPGGTPILPIL